MLKIYLLFCTLIILAINPVFSADVSLFTEIQIPSKPERVGIQVSPHNREMQRS